MPDLASPRLLAGKTVLLTGASGGIGFVTARELARRGAHLVLVCRNAERGEQARAAIRQAAPASPVDLLLCDLSLIANVQDLAAEVGRRYRQLDVLVNNAGVIPGPLTITREGHELCWATNHLAVHALTNLLLPQLEAAGRARIVTVASDAHWLGEIEPAAAARNHPDNYSAFAAYCDSKLANILFTNELAHRLELTGITANCLHPGVVDTGIMAPGRTGLLKALWSLGKPFMVSPERGAQTSIYLASAPEVATVSGKYFKNCRPARLLSGRARSRAEATRLWRISEQETGIG